MKVKKRLPLKRRTDPEVLSSVCYFFFDFLQNASPGDFKTMVDGLLTWSEHSDIDDAFTKSLQKLCGVPVIEREDESARTLRQLTRAAQKKAPQNRVNFVSGHLDLVNAGSYERAFLAVCQRLLREEITQPCSGRALRIDKLLHEASNIMIGLLGPAPTNKRNAKSASVTKASKAA